MKHTILKLSRWLVGFVLVAHGFAQAVFPMRGVGVGEGTVVGLLATAGWMIAAIGFMAAGVGLLGAWPFRRSWPRLVLVAVAGSFVALAIGWSPDLVWGLVLNLAIAALSILSLPQHGFAAPEPPRGGTWARVRSGMGTAVAAGLVAYVAVTALTHSWRQSWGTTREELAMALPGDWPDRDPSVEVNHAITIHAPPPAVWPWLVQMGRDRGGFYSYDWLENLFLLDIHNADRIYPEWQQRAVGELVAATPPGWLGLVKEPIGWPISQLEPERALVLKSWGAFVLVPGPGGTTRFIVRSKFGDRRAPAWGCALSFALLDLPHFIMERRMLIGIKERAESGSWNRTIAYAPVRR